MIGWVVFPGGSGGDDGGNGCDDEGVSTGMLTWERRKNR